MQEVAIDSLAVLQALAEPRRLRIVEALAERDREVEDLCLAVGLSQPAVSHHLRILRHCGLVISRRSGRFQDYHLLPGPLQELATWLSLLGKSQDNETQAARYRDLVIEDFLEQPLPRRLPAHPRKRSLISHWLHDRLEAGRFYRFNELADWLGDQVVEWQDLLQEWQQSKMLDGNGEYFRKP